MVLFKKWFKDIPITKDLILLLIIGGLYSLSINLSNTFVNVFLWKQSQSFSKLAIFNLAMTIAQIITFVLAGNWAKKIDRVFVLRVGIFSLASFFITVLLLGEKASSHLIILGAILGIGYGFYWLAFNVLTFEITEPETRDFFNGLMGALGSFGGIVGPFSAGFIITRFTSNIGYTIIFAISFGLFIVAIILSFFLKRRSSSGKFLLKRILLLERKQNPLWKKVTQAHFFHGFREGIFAFVISIFIYMATNNELSLGTYGLIHAGIAFIIFTLTTKYIKESMRKKVMGLGSTILFLSIFIIIFKPSYVMLLIYGFITGVAFPLLLVPFSSMTWDVIGKSRNAKELRIEYIVGREAFLQFGRISSILLFLVAMRIFPTMFIIQLLLIIFSSGYLIAVLIMRKINLQKREIDA